MRNVNFWLIGLLFAAAYAVAGGAASFVAKKSNTGEFAYSEATQQAFLKDCSENANEWVCGCVLGRLQGSYSEKEYLKLDAEMQRGDQDYNFTSFLSDAVTACDKEYEEASSVITEEEAKAFADTLLKNINKKEYLAECKEYEKAILGNKEAGKVCNCVYNKVTKDKSRLVQVILEEGYPENGNVWGVDYVLECLPDKFTPEIEKSFAGYLNQFGLPKSMSKCMVSTLKKEYTLKALVKAYSKDREQMATVLMLLAAKCAVE